MINSRRRNADGLAVTIRPRLGSRVNPAMACSIPPSSRASIGVNSTPSDGATAWIAANWGPLLTRALAFVLVERSLRPRVGLFAPLRDKVTSSAQSLGLPILTHDEFASSLDHLVCERK